LNNDRIKAEIRKSLKDIIKVAGRENVLHAKRDGYCTWVVHVPFKTNKFLGTDEIPVIDGFIVELRYCSSNKFHPECVTIKMMESTWYQRPEAA
jgi:hypothetical protein